MTKEKIKYEQFKPTEHLKNYVKFFWFVEGTNSKTFDVIADGCPGIVFHQAENGLFMNQTKKLSTIFLYGQTVRPIEMNAEGKFRIIGLHLHPHVMKSLFGFNANELTDTCIDLNLLLDPSNMNLSEQLIITQSVEKQIHIISEYLFQIIKKNNVLIDELMHFAVHHLIKSNGKVRLRELQRMLNLSERTFERKFEQYVGISPSLFARICRFQSSLIQLKNKNYYKLSDVAYENSYSDQPHFTRSFKEFTGQSPSKFQKQSQKVDLSTPVFIKA
ncbi:MAG: helix-turn-helix domain-containing protein [Bacteroidota bacterium]